MVVFCLFQVVANNADGDGKPSDSLSVFIPNSIQKPTGKVDFNLLLCLVVHVCTSLHEYTHKHKELNCVFVVLFPCACVCVYGVCQERTRCGRY